MSTCNCSRPDRDCNKCRGNVFVIVEKQWYKFQKELSRPSKVIPKLKKLFKNENK